MALITLHIDLAMPDHEVSIAVLSSDNLLPEPVVMAFIK